MKKALNLLILALIGCPVGACQTQPRDKGEPPAFSEEWQQRHYPADPELVINYNIGDIEMVAIVEQSIDDIFPTLIGGTVAVPADYPASFVSRQGNSGCTGTAIGPQVFQLAAHCVGDGRTARITANGATVDAVCTHAPGYRNDSTADWALCKFPAVVDLAWYEKVLQDAAKIKVGTKVRLGGNGCTSPGGGDGNFGTFRIGEASVTRVPTSNNDTVTEGGAALCFGDSGGSAWVVEGTQRWVLGVNSRGNIRTTSYLSSVFTAEAKTFYGDWATKNGVKICGMHADAPKCQGSATPPPSPVPPHCVDTFEKMNKCVFGNPRLALTEQQACRDAYAAFFACEAAAELEQ